MKKAIVILHGIAVVQFFGLVACFAVMKQGFYYAGKSLIELCDQRYVQK